MKKEKKPEVNYIFKIKNIETGMYYKAGPRATSKIGKTWTRKANVTLALNGIFKPYGKLVHDKQATEFRRVAVIEAYPIIQPEIYTVDAFARFKDIKIMKALSVLAKEGNEND